MKETLDELIELIKDIFFWIIPVPLYILLYFSQQFFTVIVEVHEDLLNWITGGVHGEKSND